ncbi:pilus assembly protein [Pseudogulbenkiania sp. MAI-1]|uniref:pilus assembly protein n=1 Tax=Pseudogulbenkiania sp. MAI-1 TaxID=990370 RepID=UPI00045E8F5F|nr:PilC/PilY family type IV pilus protein [Pseudogulbenkiania sp. MAI-1]
MFTARWNMRHAALATTLAVAPLLAQADITTTLPDYPLEVCTTSIDLTQSGSAAAVTNSNIVQGDNTLFASYYNYSNLSGDLKAFSIDTTTGAVSSTALWSAQSNIGTSRTLYTYDPETPSTPKQLTTSICSTGSGSHTTASTWVDYLNTTSIADCENVITALRGSSTVATGLRTYKIGTIVHSEAVFVPNLARVFQAANDGMLHAFHTVTGGSGSNATTAGAEAWAYIPRAFLAASVGQSEAPKIDSYVRSTYILHKYWLDASPAIETFTTTSGNTTTYTNYFASGYGKGAKGAYALTLGASSPTPKWQFNTSTDSNAGYLYGRPIITQVMIGTTLTKVAIFASGFNNTDLSSLSSNSYLYVVDLSTTTPTLLKTFSVAGKGLNYIAGFADSYSALNQVKYVYGGDLDGNVWRFNLTATAASSWTVNKLASLSAPITSEPELSEITINGTPKRFVYVGTGRYLTSSDISSSETGSMYGLIDRIDTVTGYDDEDDATTPSQLSTVTLSSSNYATDTNTTALETYGWKAQLPSGQRVINSPALANGKVLFTANKPADPCDANTTSPMESWLYVIDYKTGLQTGYFSLSSLASSAGLSDTHFLASRPTVVKLSSGNYKAMIRTTDGETLAVDVGTLLTTSGGSGGTVKGMFWREVITQ